MVHVSLLDNRLSDQAFRNRRANRIYRESERHVKLHVKLSFLSTLSLREFLDRGNFLSNSPVLLFQSSSITKYTIMGLVLNLVVICLYIHFFKVIYLFIV